MAKSSASTKETRSYLGSHFDGQSGTIARRLTEARKAAGLYQTEMAEKYGVAISTWRNYESGKSVPDMSLLMAMVLQGFSPTWLLTGEGEIFTDEGGPGWQVFEDIIEIAPYLKDRKEKARAVERPRENRVDIVLSADSSAFLLQTLDYNPERLSIRYVRGDAMAPVLEDGEPVLLWDTHGKVAGDGLYSLLPNGSDTPIFRRLQMQPDGTVLALCENSAYSAFEFTPKPREKAPRVLGRVIWSARQH